jgi:hypothetical protein
MYGLSLGVRRINEVLPPPVYALLSGLNASTVGIIALAAVQLSEKAIKDNITRVLVLFGACAGVCYNALWYFPVLMVIGGLTTLLWDGHLKPQIGRFRAHRLHMSSPEGFVEDTGDVQVVPLQENSSQPESIHRRPNTTTPVLSVESPSTSAAHVLEEEARTKAYTIRIWVGAPIMIAILGEYPL